MKNLRKLHVSSILLLSFVYAEFAKAGLFTISNRNYGSANATAQAEYDKVLNELETQVNNNLPNADASNYLSAIANSAVTSGSGVGVDYHSPFSMFLLGAQVGAGADLGPGNSTKDLIKGDIDGDRIRGFGAQGAILGGVNLAFLPNYSLGPVQTERLKVFAHFFTLGRNVSEVKVNTMSFGVHGQYKLIQPWGVGFGLAKWNGLDVTTGFKMSRLKATISKSLDKSATKTLAAPISADVTARFTGTATVEAKANAYTIPIEVSSAFRLLYFLGAFGGLGTDISFGSAKGSASAVGDIVVTGGPDTVSGTASIGLGQKKSPKIADFRYFIGPHIELGVLSIYAQYTQALISKTVGVNAGLNFFW